MNDPEMSKKAPLGWAAFPQLFGPAVEAVFDRIAKERRI
jgi:hypothetical protein